MVSSKAKTNSGDHLYVVSGKAKTTRSQIRGEFSPTWVFPALTPRHPLTRANTSPPPPTNVTQQLLLLQAGDIEKNPGPAPRCGVCRKSTTAKAVICCNRQKSIHHRCILELWRQANDYQCPYCRSVHNSLILYCKCGEVFRLNHNRATCGICDATAP